ncbi:MAG: glycerol-3-phosphate acyltransferase [Ilumatobacteraceae bacterium]
MAASAVVLAITTGYLIGSIPVAALVTRLDLREVGDRNPGYWNAKETLGRRAAVPVFMGDVLKGVAAAGVGVLLAPDGDWWVAYVAAFAAMVGHAWPVFARFRGGRSVLTFAGAVCVLSPVTAAISIGVLLVVMLATRSFAWAARAGVAVFPFVQIVVDGPYRTAATGCLMTLIGVRFAQAAVVSRTSGRATSAGV